MTQPEANPNAPPAKPPNLIYGAEDRPPLPVLMLLGFQHISVMTIALVIVVMIANTAKASFEDAGILVRLALLTMGLTSILQGIRRGGIGSCYLCPSVCGPAYIGASMAAAKAGGIALVSGMLLMVGVFETLLSRFISRLRALFPTHVIGLVVLMVGFEAVVVSVPRFLGTGCSTPSERRLSVFVALAALAAMMIPTVWVKGRLRLYSVLMGLAAGYATAIASGLLGHEALERISREPWFDWPRPGHFGWKFDPLMIVPFLIATLSSTLKSVGDLSMCQKINDPAWTRPDLKPIGRGVMAIGLGNLCSGLAGGLGMSTSSSNVGLSISLGATSRVILFAVGGLMVALSFFPKIAAMVVLMPDPVMGACLVYASCYMLVAGFQLLCVKPMTLAESFVIGISLCFSFSVDLAPQLFEGLPAWLHPFFQSSLTLATLMAMILNLVFCAGAREDSGGGR